MVRWFRWMTAVNVVGVFVLLLALTLPAVFAFIFQPRYSGELMLVPVDVPARAEAPPWAAAAAHERLEVPAQYQTPDLAARPWDELPGGAVRFRN